MVVSSLIVISLAELLKGESLTASTVMEIVSTTGTNTPSPV